RTHPNVDIVPEHLASELQQCPLQVAHTNALVDDEPFDLHELMRMRRIVVVPAIYFAWANNFDRNGSTARLHRTSLYRRSLRPQQDVFRDEEGILHIARRMILRQI